MHIDAHQHFWRYNAHDYGWIDDSMTSLRRDFLPSDLAPELQRNGFEGCVAVQTRQTLEETQWLLELADASSFIVGVVGWVDLKSSRLRSDLQQITANSKLVGVRHIVQSEPDDRFLLRRDFLDGVAMLEEFGLAYDILIYPRHLPVALEFVRELPRQRFVLDHLAKPAIKERELRAWAAGIPDLESRPNVMCKLSGLVTEADWSGWTSDQIRPYLDVAFEQFGPERLMIGSDWPVCTLAASYSRVIEVVVDYLKSFPTETREAVMGGNARRLWRLKY